MNSRKSHRPLNSKIEVPWDPSEDLAFNATPDRPAEQVRLSEIHLPNQQPRRYFDPQAQQKLIESVREHGILQPLLVRPRSTGGYELVAGERRYRAAAALELAEVPVVKRELSDAEAFQLALVENLQREDLNPLEETEGILQLLALKLQQPVAAIPALLHRLQHQQKELARSSNNVIGRLSERQAAQESDLASENDVAMPLEERSSNNVIGKEDNGNSAVKASPLDAISSEQAVVEDIFKSVGRMTWESFINNRLPLLNLPEDVQEAVRSGNIAYTKARAIAQIKEEPVRRTALAQAIAEDWSLETVKAHLRTLKSQPTLPPLRQQFETTYRKVKQAKLWEDPSRQERLRSLLSELESLLGE